MAANWSDTESIECDTNFSGTVGLATVPGNRTVNALTKMVMRVSMTCIRGTLAYWLLGDF
jgi:hypothetical protein